MKSLFDLLYPQLPYNVRVGDTYQYKDAEPWEVIEVMGESEFNNRPSTLIKMRRASDNMEAPYHIRSDNYKDITRK